MDRVNKLDRFPSDSANGQVIGILSATGDGRNDVGKHCDRDNSPTLFAARSIVCRDNRPAAAVGDNGVKDVAGYRAGSGWDACTGWGSPIGATLRAVLGAAVPERQLVASPPASAPTEA